MARLTVLLSVVLLSVAAAPVVELDDQFGDTVRVLAADAGPFVLIYSDREGSKHALPWVEAVANDACPVIEAANLAAAPAVARPFVRRALRGASPVLLDWHGELATALGFAKDQPNIYVVGHGGSPVRHLHGLAEPERLARLDRDLREICDGMD